MAFWGKKKRQPPGLSCYGKLPATGDFIRLNAAGEENTTFDNWLGGSIHHAREALGDAFNACYQPALGLFIYRGPDRNGEEPDRGMVGAWASSGDSAGRRYPMIVSTTYDYEELLAVGAATPIATWSFLQQAYALVAGGRQMPVDGFLGRVQQLQPVPLDPPEQAVGSYRQWTQTQTMRSFWETTLGDAARRTAAVANIIATLDIFAGQERPQTSLAIRFPTGAADFYAVSVWMDMTLRIAKWERTVLNAFWTPQYDLMVHVGPPQVQTFRELIMDGSDADHVTDLCRAPTMDESQAQGYLGARAEAVADMDQTIGSFLQRL